jgi:hypothetical protein
MVQSKKICLGTVRLKSPEGIRMFLPQEIKDTIPDDIVGVIESFLPKPSKRRKILKQSIQRELEKLRKVKLKGMKDTYLREFDVFAWD